MSDRREVNAIAWKSGYRLEISRRNTALRSAAGRPDNLMTRASGENDMAMLSSVLLVMRISNFPVTSRTFRNAAAWFG
jgi:hypothetical protein